MHFFRRRHMSPLLLLLVFTCFSPAQSRHRIRHHRDRFKRQQGAHLFLPGSYVYEGGEGADVGPWGDWSAPTACSRSCGGGVATETRQCQQGYTCRGPTSRHYSCNTQDCPDFSDFRAVQCAEFDGVPFNGRNHAWLPYIGPNPCELNCMPRGERFYYRHRLTVIDGTRCNGETNDVCVQGKCQPVGCDMMLGSPAREDLCRVCGGDGSTCNTVRNRFDKQDLQLGYNDILMIPSGATHILLEDVKPSNNYLAIRNTSGHYYLNGNWSITSPAILEFAGCKFNYKRSTQIFPGQNKITCLGPTNEALFLVLLLEETNVGVDYEYSIPNNIQTGAENETYMWIHKDFSTCSAACGGGTQNTNVICAGRRTLEPADERLCDPNNKPPSSRACSEVPCEAQWVPYPWGNCSAPCGEGGVQNRWVGCQQVISNGQPSVVDEAECAKAGPKPAQEQACNMGKVCAQWHADPWKPCDHLCGDGLQTRTVVCYRKIGNKIDVLEESDCSEPKLETEKKCNIRPCEGVDWIISDWSGCDKCGLTNETRKVYCATAEGKIFADDICEKEKKPKDVRQCTTTNKNCEYSWYASQWSECSAACGKGIQTRTLFCGVVAEDKSVKEVDKKNCDNQRTYETIQNCTAEVEVCAGEWFSGPWNDCSKPCGGGERSKKVVCLKDLQVTSPKECGSEKIIFREEECNTQACSDDTILPISAETTVDESDVISTTVESETVSSASIVADDDDEYEIVPDDKCDDGEWVGGEEDEENSSEDNVIEFTTKSNPMADTSMSDDDLMLSDAPSSPEGSDGTTISGSGDGELTSPTSALSSSTDNVEGSGEDTTITTEPITMLISTSPESSELSTESQTSGNSDSSTESQTSGNTDSSTESQTTGNTDSSTESQTSGNSDSSTESQTSGNTDSSTESQTSGNTDSSTESQTSGNTDSSTESQTSGNTDSSTESQTSDNTDSTTTESQTSSNSDSTTESQTSSNSDSSTESQTSSNSDFTVNTSSSSGSSEPEETTTPITTTEQSSSTVDSTVVTNVAETTLYHDGDDGRLHEVDADPYEDLTIESTDSSGTVSTTKVSGSTESITTDVVNTDGITTESVATDGVTTESGSTNSVSTDGVTTESGFTDGVTTEGLSTDGATTEITTEIDIWSTTSNPEITTVGDKWETTPINEIFKGKGPRMCKRKKTVICKSSKHGCCWDHVSPAKGPFNAGCPTPKTCRETKFGCCQDGLSLALGPKFKGCPSSQCNETLFGCCQDELTPAKGYNQQGCPPPPPACLSSKYGCCKDNITNAQGPKYKGCEPEVTPAAPSAVTKPPENCANTTHGCCPDNIHSAQGEYYKGCDIFKDNCTQSYYHCCPDGITSAEGPNYHGCKTECSGSDYGCCEDGITPAHGPNKEGCCLASPFGCCPDNIVASRGPHLEGCGCQYSPHGCCPDNATAARGPNNEGCGCQYTEHGCCADNYNPAAGPEFTGCLCHTFQFGCCPDGVSVAKGPHQQGCGCRNTEFGCCSDDSTPAQGQNQTGCGCEATKYGCCPDGITEAKGEEFDGCENIPVNLQEACTQGKERGSCRNYTVKWYYDKDYGGCSRFWYGGCDGNENRYKSKDDCEDVCVNPKGTDRCNLPKIPGPCEGYYPKWYYDKDAKQCAPFVYSGCLGNNNRFETREECMGLCVVDKSVDACEQDKLEGPCRGNYRRWYFDKEQKTCQQFVYGGCKSNNNNFPTEEACKQQCSQPGRKKDHCSLPRAQGNCTQKEPKWYYDMPEKRCLPFYHSGCNGNNNNFNSREACEADCPKDIVKDTCQLAAETGSCGNYTERWYFDTKDKSCRQFYYGGCEGNGNNFVTRVQCEQRCDPSKLVPEEPPKTPEEPFSTDMCFLPSETGNCRAAHVRYYYDRNDGVCKNFIYGGCNGNRNNFETVNDCQRHCGNAQDLCSLPRTVGSCNAEHEYYYYENRTDSCRTFIYGGCGGNYNRFPDQASCEQRCRQRPPQEEVQTNAPPGGLTDVAMCYEPAHAGNGTEYLTVYFFNLETSTCTPFTYSGTGGNGNRFQSEEQCERQCGKFRGQDVCNLDRDPGPCREYFVKYYYEKSAGRCAQFAYGGCEGNGNRFSSNEECESLCVTHEEKRSNETSTGVCKLPEDAGSCQTGQHQRWYFNLEQKQCVSFSFSGCGGNLNNFKTYQSCVDFCAEYLAATEPPAGPDDHPCQARFDECASLKCPYGIESHVGEDLCSVCQCINPCNGVYCQEGLKCAIDFNRNKTDNQDPNYVGVCREINKPGECPNLAQEQGNCEEECRDDADCSLHLKCCRTACGSSCTEPTNNEAPAPLVTQQQPAHTPPPVQSQYVPPQVDVLNYKPEVQGEIGDHVTLNCAITGNPNPQITWRKGDLLIDGSQAKYRMKLDQSLQIITLHRTDAGVYLCTADNNVGEPLSHEINLQVVDSEPRPVSFLPQEDEPNVVVSLNSPTTINCLPLGYPFAKVTWWKDDAQIQTSPYFQTQSDNSLLITSVRLPDLGIYTCQAYNGLGKAASWQVVVKAKGPYFSTNPDDKQYLQYIVNPPETPTLPPQYPTPPPYQHPRPEINEIDLSEVGIQPNYIVPVQTNITLGSTRFPTNSDVEIPCVVTGYPDPQVQWYKDGVLIVQTNRIYSSGDNTLILRQVTKADSGIYQCEADNSYSRASSSTNILIDGMNIHPDCKDNRFLANCQLIVEGKFCTHEYYARYCCRSCTEAGQLSPDGSHFQGNNQRDALRSNFL